MPQPGTPLDPATRVLIECGMRHRELNTIIQRINKRRIKEATPEEKARILELKAEIREWKGKAI